MAFRVKRIYEEPESADGVRVLVDRLWPRGLSREKARLDLWMKEVAPSNELRKSASHEPEKWDEFRRLYFAELEGNPEPVARLLELGRQGTVTLLFARREETRNNATALKEYLEGVGEGEEASR